jgi:protein MBA1
MQVLKRYTCQEYYDNAIKLARAYKRPDRRVIWSLLSETTPCKIVSMRAVEANFSSTLKPGVSRLACQVLVRFDTLQSIRIQSLRSNRGNGADAETKKQNVVEYLVLEKRLWQDVPWSIRERVYEGVQEKFIREADLR